MNPAHSQPHSHTPHSHSPDNRLMSTHTFIGSTINSSSYFFFFFKRNHTFHLLVKPTFLVPFFPLASGRITEVLTWSSQFQQNKDNIYFHQKNIILFTAGLDLVIQIHWGPRRAKYLFWNLLGMFSFFYWNFQYDGTETGFYRSVQAC